MFFFHDLLHVFPMKSSELSSEGQCMLVDKLDLLEPQWPGLEEIIWRNVCVVQWDGKQ